MRPAAGAEGEQVSGGRAVGVDRAPGQWCAQGGPGRCGRGQPRHRLGALPGRHGHLGQAVGAGQGGGDAQPADGDGRGHRPDARHEAKRCHAQHGRGQRRGQPGCLPCPPVAGSVPHAGDRAAQPVEPEQRACGGLVAVMLGERDGGQVDGDEHGAEGDAHRGQDPQAGAAQRRRVGAGGRRGRRLAAPLSGQARHAGDAERGGGQHGRDRPEGGVDGDDQHRAGDEDELVGDALQRECGVQQGRAVEQPTPPGAYHRVEGRHGGAAEPAGHNQSPHRCPADAAQRERGGRRGEGDHLWAQHPALPVAVGEPGYPGGQRRIQQCPGGRDRPGDGIASGDGGDEHDLGQAEHAHRHPADGAGDREGQRARRAQRGPVPGQPRPLGCLRDRCHAGDVRRRPACR